MNITRHTQAALVAALLAAGSLTPLATTARAATVHFNSGSVAFGYSDGYWDRSHHWHRWPTTTARTDWRAHNREHYYGRSHRHDHASGWREDDRWWGR